MNRCQKLGALMVLGWLLTIKATAQPVLNAVPAMGGTVARWGNAMVWVDELGGEHRVSAQGQVVSHQFAALPAELLATVAHPQGGYLNIHPRQVVHHTADGRPPVSITLPRALKMRSGQQVFKPMVEDQHLLLPSADGLFDIDLTTRQVTTVLTEFSGMALHAVRHGKGYLVVTIKPMQAYAAQGPVETSHLLLDDEGGVVDKLTTRNQGCMAQGLRAGAAHLLICRAAGAGGDFEVIEARSRLTRRMLAREALLPGLAVDAATLAAAWDNSPSVGHGLPSLQGYDETAHLYLPGLGMFSFSLAAASQPQGRRVMAALPDDVRFQSHQHLTGVHWLHNAKTGLTVTPGASAARLIPTTALNAVHAQVDAQGVSLAYPGGQVLRISADGLPRLANTLGRPPWLDKQASNALPRFPGTESDELRNSFSSKAPPTALISKITLGMVDNMLTMSEVGLDRAKDILEGPLQVDVPLAGAQLRLRHAKALMFSGLEEDPAKATVLQVGSTTLLAMDLKTPYLPSLLGLQLPNHSNLSLAGGALRSLSGLGGTWCLALGGAKASKLPAPDAFLFDLNDTAYGIAETGEVQRFKGCSTTPMGRLPAPVRSLRLQANEAYLLLTNGQVARLGSQGLTMDAGKQGLQDVASDNQGAWVGFDGQALRNHRQQRRAASGVLLIAPLADNRFAVQYRDGRTEVIDTALTVLFTVYMTPAGPISISPEGFFDGSFDAANLVTARVQERQLPLHQFYDIFYHPDILHAKLTGDADYVARVAQGLTLEVALRSPPPSVVLPAVAETSPAQRLRLAYNVKSDGGGGVGEVLVLHNGKLIKSDGYYRDAPGSTLVAMDATKASSGAAVAAGMRKMLDDGEAAPGAGASAGAARARNSVVIRQAKPKVLNAAGEFSDSVEIDVIPGEDNEITVMARNADNTILGQGQTVRFKSTLPKADPHLWILPVGVGRFADGGVPTLASPKKDALDFACSYGGRDALKAYGLPCNQPGYASGLFKPGNIHVVEPLTNEKATRANILARLDEVAAKAKPGDTFVWFVSSHGTMDANSVYGIVPFDARCKGKNCDGLVSSNDILDKSKAIKAMKQLLVLDTCQAGALDTKMSGLYDARMAGLAKNMGLHLYAAATATESALDGQDASKNSIFTATLLEGLSGKAARNSEGAISIIPLGQYVSAHTPEAARKAWGNATVQTPLVQHFGKDAPLAAGGGLR